MAPARIIDGLKVMARAGAGRVSNDVENVWRAVCGVGRMLISGDQIKPIFGSLGVSAARTPKLPKMGQAMPWPQATPAGRLPNISTHHGQSRFFSNQTPNSTILFDHSEPHRNAGDQ